MKILVCVSKTPETTAKISFTADNTTFNSAGVQYIMNPYDEWYALVRALELKEQAGGTVSIINVGPSDNDQTIRKGLAIGADNAVRVDCEPKSSLYVAKQIAAHAKAESYDVIFFGKETIDYNGSEIGAMVSELLDLPFISFATKLTMDGNTATVERDIEGGIEVAEVDTPVVFSCAKGMAEQRIPNMRGIMMAKRKPLTVIPAVEAADLAVTVGFEMPPAKSDVKMIDPENMDELVKLLYEEAKIL